MNTQDIFGKLGNLRNVLKDDGVHPPPVCC